MEVFRGHSSFIFQSKVKDKMSVEIFDSKRKLLASCKHKYVWKDSNGSYCNNVQIRLSEIVLEGFDGSFGWIIEFPAKIVSFRLIKRRYEIYDNNRRFVGEVREKAKIFGSDWVLYDLEGDKIAKMVGNRKKKDYKIQSQGGEPFAKCYRDSGLGRDSYRVDIFVGWERLFLVLCYVLVLHIAKNVVVTSENTYFLGQ